MLRWWRKLRGSRAAATASRAGAAAPAASVNAIASAAPAANRAVIEARGSPPARAPSQLKELFRGHLPRRSQAAHHVHGSIYLARRQQRVRGAVGGASATGASNAVRMVIEALGHVKVDDGLDGGDIEAA